MTGIADRDRDKGDRKPTQAMPEGEARGSSDGLALSGAQSGTSPMEGGPYPNPHTGGEGKSDAGSPEHGGQSVSGYYGTGQLGKQKTRPEGAPNSATNED